MGLNFKLREFTITRKTWRSGGEDINKHGEGLTSLLNDQGQMCCLGQIAKQIGFDNIQGEAEPCQLPLKRLDPEGECLLIRLENEEDHYEYEDYFNSEFSLELMSINDDENIDIIERERQIIEAAAKFKVTIKFQ